MVSYENPTYLVIQSQNGDRQSLGELAVLVRQRMLGYLYKRTSDNNASEDIIQEVLLAIVLHIDQLRSPNRFWPWVYTIALSKTKAHFLRNGRIDEIERKFGLQLQKIKTFDNDFHNQIERRERIRELYVAMGKLKKEYAEAIELRAFGQLPHKEIARLTSVSCSQTRLRVFRARQILRRRLSVA